MTLAADAREAVRRHPFLLAGLRAGVVNYTAAARFLDVDGDVESVATALRRFAEELDDRETASREARVTMQRGVGVVDDGGSDGEATDGGSDGATENGSDGNPTDGAGDDAPGGPEPLLAVGGAALASDAGDLTAVLADGDVDPPALAAVLDRLFARGVDVRAAGVVGDALLVAVAGRDGATALRVVEAALAAVPVSQR